MAISAIIGAGASVLGGLIGKSGSDKAAKAQAAAQAAALAQIQKATEQGRSDLQPTLDLGTLAQQVVAYERGLRPDAPIIGSEGFRVGGQTYATRAEAERALDAATNAFNSASRIQTYIPTAYEQRETGIEADQMAAMNRGYRPGQTALEFDPRAGAQAAGFDPRGASIETLNPQRYGGFALTPGQEFLKNEALADVTAYGSAAGSLNSGATLESLQDRSTSLNNTFREKYLASLGALSTQGQQAATNLASLGAGAGVNAANIITSGGNAQGANAIAGANNLAQGLSLGVNALTKNVDFGGLNSIFGTTGGGGTGGLSGAGVTF